MLDLHCHILPAVDDGAVDMDTSLEMARALCHVGFTHIAASPHFGEGPGGDVPLELAKERRELLNARLRAEGIALEILVNAEHHVTPLLFERLKGGIAAPIGGNSQWLLVELPWGGVPQVEQVMFLLQSTGYRLLLAHPERYRFLENDVVEKLVERGVCLQLELGSFISMYGSRAQKHAVRWAKAGLAHVIATDLHKPDDASLWMADALATVRKLVGNDGCTRALETNPKAMVANASAAQILPFG